MFDFSGLRSFLQRGGRGFETGQRAQHRKTRWQDNSPFFPLWFATWKPPTLMFSVSGGAISDAAARAAKSFRRFTAILFKGRRKLEFKVTALKVGFPLSSEAFALPHPTPGCQKWVALWPCLRPNLWAAAISSPCDGPAVTTGGISDYVHEIASLV